ncbi:hypothetical protein Focb16_v006128 [Fusarium oxysporum f. sp. cubense]|uniref:DDE-1 domain-containing protein n=1 Tax=Fusarium oxysporum f. sp. cubense TaxID=61366 RepID=A0A559LIR5_FUSOC|nr:hypothetical protein Focb16_v006128 [Fusarium oxysporum f. sp. cubense]
MAVNWYFDIRESEYGWIKPENTANVNEGGIMAGFDGRLLKPGIIFKGKELQKQWFIDEFNKIADWYYITSDNGWTDNHIAVEWLKEVYLPQTQPADESDARLIILDGHGSHVSPLDNGVFNASKAAYRKELQKLASLTDSAPVDKVNFIKAYAKAREVGMMKKNILSGWRVTGNWPISRRKALIHAEIQPDKKETMPGSDGHRDRQVDSDNTPKTSRHIRDLGKNKSPSTRRRIASLEEEVGRLSRGKKRKAIPNPNKKFITLAEALAAGDTISEPNEAIEGADVVEDVIEVGGIEEDERPNSGKEELGIVGTAWYTVVVDLDRELLDCDGVCFFFLAQLPQTSIHALFKPANRYWLGLDTEPKHPCITTNVVSAPPHDNEEVIASKYRTLSPRLEVPLFPMATTMTASEALVSSMTQAFALVNQMYGRAITQARDTCFETDHLFREVSYLPLSMASCSPGRVRFANAEGLGWPTTAYKSLGHLSVAKYGILGGDGDAQPRELVSTFLSDFHEACKAPGSAPYATSYWMGPVFVWLTRDVLSRSRFEAAIYAAVTEGRAVPGKREFPVVVFSIRHFVLVRVTPTIVFHSKRYAL